MDRDGKRESLWQEGLGPYVTRPAEWPSATVDILIAGGGITGISTAYELQKRGLSCLLIEAHTLGYGTTGGTTAHLNSMPDTSFDILEKKFGASAAKTVFGAMDAAVRQIEKNARELQIDCDFEFKKALLFSKTSRQSSHLEEIIEKSRKAGLDIAPTDDPVMDLPHEKVAVIANQAQFHPVKYIYALAAAFEKAGGTIIQHCRLNSFDEKDGITVETTMGKIQSKRLFFATHIPPGINLLDFRCAPYRSYALAAELIEERYPDCLIYDMDEPYHYYRTHILNGKKYLVFGGEDHKTGHDENALAHFRNLESMLSEQFKVADIPYKWSSQFYEPVDGLPYIGELPGHSENVFVATGFSGNGMTWSQVAAVMIPDLITGRQHVCRELLDPKRVKPMAGFTHFIKENAEVVRDFVTDRITADKVNSLAEIPPGEGRIIRYEGDPLAVYKDGKGVIHAVNPVCTHVKCIVQWNNAEKSWDCPCHGARYSIDGEVLTGPSTMDLKQVRTE